MEVRRQATTRPLRESNPAPRGRTHLTRPSGLVSPFEIERPLPHNLDAERAVLGAILLDNAALATVIEKVRPEDFFLPEHRRIFARMIAMAKAGQAIDLVTLHDELHRHRELEASGGAGYVAQLVDGVPLVTNVEHYACIVKEKALLRNLAYAGDSITQAALDPGADPEEILERIEMLSAQFREGVRAERKLQFRTGAEIATETPPQVDWLAFPWVAAGSITELAGKVKVAGKTTLATHLVRAVLDGTPFLGEPTTKTPVVYLTEQPPASFRVAMSRAELLGRPDFVVLYWNETVGRSWEEVVQAAIEECKRRGGRLLVMDTLSQFAGLVGDEENNSGDALSAMRPLQLAAAQGIGIVVVRHERKSGGEVGDSGRGSSAYAGAVDTVLSIRRPEGNTRRKLRVIKGVSRFDQVPDELVVELTTNGYVALGNTTDIAAKEAEQVILAATPESEADAITLDKLLDGTAVKRASGQRAMKNLLDTGRLVRTGEGKRGDPFRYFKPEIHSAQTPTTNGQNEKLKPGGAGTVEDDEELEE